MNRSPSFGISTQIQVIPVYFHVVSEGTTVLSGNILPWTIDEQMRVLNETFEGTGVQFILAGVDRTVNAAWYHKAYPGNAENEEMMLALRKGGVADLNFYSVKYVISFHISVGTHEVGHWLGLLHPFEVPEGSSGCEDVGGDYVDDTPAENGPAMFCPIGRDSCPGGGPDPIHNYMDYTDDYCRFEFTPGQVRRLQALTRHYRGISFN
ncbi:hypothetical protein CVT24_003828 [Panaeolus cyanescens]|uniref:Peptidase M43 pregnancy-associated plasma-A domain-containing protein n=1 Tax=Panaeolus cyanescens TaxID=181874 RepID=A0A409YXE5_9AGAR|nr:hypothetical protein CVT24_003828 [Panaeolus cyanescens]